MFPNKPLKIKPAFITRFIKYCTIAFLAMSVLCFIAAITTQIKTTPKKVVIPQETTTTKEVVSTDETTVQQESAVNMELIIARTEVATQILKCRMSMFFVWIGCALALVLILAAIIYSFRYSWADIAKEDRERAVLNDRIKEIEAYIEVVKNNAIETSGRAEEKRCWIARIFCKDKN